MYPRDTGRKLNVHKTFRTRPGRLLNVLCTLNLGLCLRGSCLVAIVRVRFNFKIEYMPILFEQMINDNDN